MGIYDQKQSLGHLTGLASRLFNNLLTTRFQQAGIDMTAEQWGIILVLLNENAVTQKQIGELLYLEKSSVSRSIDGLEKREWIERKKDPGDSRKKIVTLTARAVQIAERCSSIARGVLEDAQRQLDENEVVVNQKHLSVVIGNLRDLNK